MSFNNSDLLATEDLLREKFNRIKQCKLPRLSKSWNCSKLWMYGKTTFEDTHIPEITEYRDNQVCNVGDSMTMCEHVKHDIQLKGMKEVVDEYTVPGYNVGHYKAPGSTE